MYYYKMFGEITGKTFKILTNFIEQNLFQTRVYKWHKRFSESQEEM